MTNAELIQTIRAEIERRKEQAKQHYEQAYSIGRCDAFSEMLNFIYDLEESEKPMNPEDAMKELDEKIALVKQRGTWDGVDVDKYMDEVRGREPEKPMNLEGLEEEIHEYNKERFDEYFPEQDGDFISEVDFMTCLDRVAEHFAQWGAENLKK